MKPKANPLEKYFLENSGRMIDKWMGYFDIYHRHFEPYRGRRPVVVEFGVQHGGSARMWKHYFGRGARIIGVDIDPRCAALAEAGIEIMIGDQDDREFLAGLAEKIGPVDVVIEDGGHRMTQQINTFEAMWPVIRDGGVYLAEDLHTSYWERFGGGHLHGGTFIEYLKRLIDQENAWYSESPELVPDEYTRSIRGMHFYDSVVVLDKGAKNPPERRTTGVPSF